MCDIKEMKKLYKKSSYISFTIEENEDKSSIPAGNCTICFHRSIEDKDFSNEKVSISKKFHNFPTRIGIYHYKRIYFSSMLYRLDNIDNGSIGAFFRLIKENDKLIFHFSDDKNGYAEKAIIPENCLDHYNERYEGLHMDTLYCDIYRNEKAVLKNFPLIISGPCPNNTARSIQE